LGPVDRASLYRWALTGKKNYPSIQSKEACTIFIPYVKGISDMFKRIGNKYNIKTIFKTEHTLRNVFVRTKPDTKSQQQIKHCIYSIPCECGRRYIGETSRPLEVRIKEHKHNLKEGLLEKSKLAQHAYEEGHRIKWDEAKAIQKKPDTIYRKYKESAHLAYLENTFSQPSLEMSPF
jgi:predicted GIY-YIG superfamily endonuclease